MDQIIVLVTSYILYISLFLPNHFGHILFSELKLQYTVICYIPGSYFFHGLIKF